MPQRSFWLLVVGSWLWIAVLAACAPPAPDWHGSVYEPSRLAPDFEVEGTDGAPLQLADFAGQPLLLYFGYTSCPDFCPTTMADLSWVFSQLGDESDQAKVLFITVDLERDTPDRLTRYLEKFNPGFLGGRPRDGARLQAVVDAFDAYAQKDAPSAPSGDEAALPHAHEGQAAEAVTFTHSARVFLIDGEGRLITNYAFATLREEILADVQRAIEQGG